MAIIYWSLLSIQGKVHLKLAYNITEKFQAINKFKIISKWLKLIIELFILRKKILLLSHIMYKC